MKHLLLVLVLVSGAVSAADDELWITEYNEMRPHTIKIEGQSDIVFAQLSVIRLVFDNESECYLVTQSAFKALNKQVEAGEIVGEPIKVCESTTEEKHKDRS